MDFFHEVYTVKLENVLRSSPTSSELLNILCLETWLSSTPKTSTFRVNTLKYSTTEICQYIIEELGKKYEYDGDLDIPLVKIHDRIAECIVISNYKINATERHNKEIIVDSACGAAVLRGADVFAPGILGITPDTKVGSKVSVYADLSKKCSKGYKKKFDGAKLFVGNGIAEMDRQQLFEKCATVKGVAVHIKLPATGIKTINCPRDFGIMQNLPCMVCVRVLDPQPGETILDMCAAPGNKTSHIATLMNDQGTLIAIDKPNRIHLINKTCSAVGIQNCLYTFGGDSRKLIGDTHGAIICGPPFQTERFDRILLDSCCSGLGNRPLLDLSSFSEKSLKSICKLQKELFCNAVGLLKYGGTLVYSTCSILCEENECLVAWALNNFPQIELVEAKPIIGTPGLANCGLTENDRMLIQRFGIETQLDDSIGFFIAKFKKILPQIR